MRSMRVLSPVAALALLVALFVAPPAGACSPVPGYRVPTNLELVEQADLILLATVSQGDFEPDSTPTQQILLTPVAALKGQMPAAPQALSAMIATGDDRLLSNPYDLWQPHPQAFSGSCTRYSFASGTRVLFFMKDEGDHWTEAGGPFSRWAEDVLTDDAPWLTIVRLYVKIAALPPSERPSALAAARAEYGAQGDNPIAQLIAADIDRQIAGPNPPLREELPDAIDD